MSHVTIRPATMADAARFAPLLRREDVLECWASSGMGPLESLEVSLASSDPAFAAHARGRPLCVWGAAPCEPPPDGRDHYGKDCARAWLLATDLIERHARAFLSACGPELGVLMAHYDVLWNWSDARNAAHARWLRWLGFQEVTTVPYDHYTPGAPVDFTLYVAEAPRV